MLSQLLQFIRRHKQSISLVFIAGILLLIAFYMSQLTRSADERPRLPETVLPEDALPSELPSCEEVASREEQLVCYTEALLVSEALLISEVDEILASEPEAERRIEFMDTQIAWEESRDADCAFVSGGMEDDWEAYLQELICLNNYNLTRLDQLRQFRCEWYTADNCEDVLDWPD